MKISIRTSVAVTACAGLAFAAAASPAHAQSTEAAQRSERSLMTHPSQGAVKSVKDTKATLVITARGAFADVAARELVPGNVHTLWWVVINNPSACEKSPCTPKDVLKRTHLTKAEVAYADGMIADRKGTARFASHLAAGPVAAGWYGNGFPKPRGAEIHLIVMDHGPLIPALAQSMLTSARGGCVSDSLPADFPRAAFADGTPGPNRCRMVQAAIFKPGSAKRATAE